MTDRASRLEQWIEREFTGYGVAMRRQDEAPLPGEPFMSMAVAKDLTRQAVAAFGKVSDLAVERALDAWFASPPSETDQGLMRSMRAAIEAAMQAVGEHVSSDGEKA